MAVKSALVGYTGFVGGNLQRQTSFDDLYRSTNIEQIRHKDYGLVVCAGAPAVKWQANREPEADIANLQRLMDDLRCVEAERFVLISTVDVYPQPVSGDEDTEIDPSALEPYGRHRFLLEQFVSEHFGKRSIIIRLPGLFGQGLKKNFIFDLLNQNALDWTHRDSRFQFYDLTRLWDDVRHAIELDIPLANFAPEPVVARDIAERSFDIDFTNITERPPVSYDMRSRYAAEFGGERSYTYSADETFRRIRAFAAQERAGAI